MKSEARIPFYLILKHILRGNKWTLSLIIFLIAIAFINLVFVSSLFQGIIDLTNNQIINTYSSSFSVTPAINKDYVQNTDELMAKIVNTPNVKAASSHINVPATLKYNNIKGNWQTIAINPEKEKEVTNISQNIILGAYLEINDIDGIIIGKQIAGGPDVEMNAFSFKDAKVGDKVNLTFGTISKDFIIRGIFYTKFIQADQRAFINQSFLDSLYPKMFDNQASEIIVKTNNINQVDLVINNLKSQGLEENFYTWEDVSGLMKSVTSSFNSINALLTIVGVIITAVTIFIVIYIDISSKRQQIGILRAIGIKPYLIDTTYVLQAVVYSVFGVILGLLLFLFIIVPYFNLHPFVLPLGDAVLSINALDLWARAEMVVWTAIASALIPSIYFTRMKILTAIWGK